MEVGTIEDVQSESAAISDEVVSVTYSTEVFTYTHEAGQTMSATVEDMGRCAVLGSLPPEVRAEIARAHIIGRQLQAEAKEETAEVEAEADTEVTEDGSDQKSEAKDHGKNARDAQQKNGSARQEAPKAENLAVVDASSHETDANNVTSDHVAVDSSVSSEGAALPPRETFKAPSVEKKVAAVASPKKVTPAASPAKVKAVNNEIPSAKSEEDPQVKSKDAEPIIIVSEAAPVLRRIPVEGPAESFAKSVIEEPQAKIFEKDKTQLPEQPVSATQVEQEPETDELHLESDTDIETVEPTSEVDPDALQADIFLELQPVGARDEQPGEFIESEVSGTQNFEELTPADEEAEVVNVSESAQDELEVAAVFSLPVEEVERVILQVMDGIEQMKVNESETAHQILDELVEKIAEAQSPSEAGSENLVATAEVEEPQEELKELFIRLFKHAEQDFSPELIESCIRLALQSDVSGLLTKVEQRKEETASQSTGTHEVIKQLIATISSIKKSIEHAQQIGASVLRLLVFRPA